MALGLLAEHWFNAGVIGPAVAPVQLALDTRRLYEFATYTINVYVSPSQRLSSLQKTSNHFSSNIFFPTDF